MTFKRESVGVTRRYLPDFSQVLPPLMAPGTGPDVSSTSSGAGSSITSAVDYTVTATTGPVTFYGTCGFSNTTTGASDYVSGTQVGSEFMVYTAEFITDAPKVEVCYLGSSSPTYRLLINNELVTSAYQTATGASGNQHRLVIDFRGVRAFRRIAIQCQVFGIKKLTLGPTDTVFAVPAPTALAVIGDSYAQGSTHDGFAHVCARLLGYQTAIINGSGGSGYVTAGSSSVFSARLVDVVAASPQAVLVAGGINDSTTGLQAAVTSLVQDFEPVYRRLRSLWWDRGHPQPARRRHSRQRQRSSRPAHLQAERLTSTTSARPGCLVPGSQQPRPGTVTQTS